jgi:hypothetical protein
MDVINNSNIFWKVKKEDTHMLHDTNIATLAALAGLRQALIHVACRQVIVAYPTVILPALDSCHEGLSLLL